MSRLLLLTAAAAIAAVTALATTAHASCIPMTKAEQRARADVIFDGVALQGPTSTGIQRFRVTRWLKGSGPRIVRVDTMNVRRPDGSGTTTSVSLVVRKGERWRIYAQGSVRHVLLSSICHGSRKL